METEGTVKLTREEQLELENATLKIEMARQQLQLHALHREDLVKRIAAAHQLKDGEFSVDVAAGEIRRAPTPLRKVE